MYKLGDVYRQKEGGTKKLGVGYFRQGYFPLVGGGVGWGLMQITSLMWIRKFQTDWFKIPLLGEAETPIKLGVKPWFDIMGF